ncbi:MAG: SLC13 family permease [Alphaproteobacteria bacterium]|nr:SLC13 family permease [Alphaproteobacteria bacterium]
MTTQQTLLFALLFFVLAALLWGKYRHDLVAAVGLFVGVIIGVIPEKQAFAGLSHPAVLIVAFALIASRAIENSGALTVFVRPLLRNRGSVVSHIVVTGGFGALISAFINNVAALAILMPIDIDAAKKAQRPPGLTLMPLSFATILGGMVTLIGTPPNIIASQFRADRVGGAYSMFDFTPVGLVVAGVGLIYVAVLGWRLVPRRSGDVALKPSVEQYAGEVLVTEESGVAGKVLAQLDPQAEANDVVTLGVVRNGRRFPGNARFIPLVAGDILLVEGSADGLAAFIKDLRLQPASDKAEGFRQPEASERKGQDIALVQAVVRSESALAGRSAAAVQLRSRYQTTLLGASRGSELIRQDLKSRRLEPGDMLLLAGSSATLSSTITALRLMPVSQIDMSPAAYWKVAVAVIPFALAIAAATLGLLSFTVGLAITVIVYGVTGLIPARDFYSHIDWPAVVMLACLLPLGIAFDQVGGTQLVASAVLWLTQGQSPIVALVALMVITITLSDVLNSVATMVITAPLAITLALKLGVNPDTFLMGATISASCSFLTPIGHKNNTLILGPGGYKFSDYWRVGLPLEILVLLVGVPTLLTVWPLNGQY